MAVPDGLNTMRKVFGSLTSVVHPCARSSVAQSMFADRSHCVFRFTRRILRRLTRSSFVLWREKRPARGGNRSLELLPILLVHRRRGEQPDERRVGVLHLTCGAHLSLAPFEVENPDRSKGIAVFHGKPSPSHHALFYHAYTIRLEAVKAEISLRHHY